jgi:hypothetical protein
MSRISQLLEQNADYMSLNKNMIDMDPAATYGESTIVLKNEEKQTSFTEVWCKQELSVPTFLPSYDQEKDSFVAEILAREPHNKGQMTPFLAFNIETYCQTESNSSKGVSRVVIVNELGERIIDTQIKLVNPAMSHRK